MDQESAKKALRLVNRVTTQALRSVHRVTNHAPEQAALQYRKRVLEILNPLSDIVFTLWARYPVVQPKREPGVTYYDPDKWNMPKAEVRRAAQTLADIQSDLNELIEFLEVKGGSGDGKLKRAAASAHAQARAAGSSVLGQHPDFRGRTPRERVVLKPRRTRK